MFYYSSFVVNACDMEVEIKENKFESRIKLNSSKTEMKLLF